jgi:hypothetical protein
MTRRRPNDRQCRLAPVHRVSHTPTQATVHSTDDDVPMTPTELRSSLSLSLIFAMRMLGLFLVLPVFALEAAGLPGGDDPARIGPWVFMA